MPFTDSLIYKNSWKGLILGNFLFRFRAKWRMEMKFGSSFIASTILFLQRNFLPGYRCTIYGFREKGKWNRGIKNCVKAPYSRFSPVMWSKLKIVSIQWIKSRILDAIDGWYINNLAKNQISAVFHSRVISRSVSPKFIELCMETPCLCPSEGHKHGGRKVTETSVTEFCYWNETLLF